MMQWPLYENERHTFEQELFDEYGEKREALIKRLVHPHIIIDSAIFSK